MSIYGRYEMVNRSTNTSKFWWVVLDESKQVVICTWGRIGNQSPPPKEYTLAEAMTKIKQKLKKGYDKVDGYEEKVGSQSIHFIKTFCGG